MLNIDKFTAGLVILGMITHMVTTPEQREEWARQRDWDYYASKFSD